MQAPSGRKRKSDQLDTTSDAQNMADTTSQKVPTKGGESHPDESAYKRQKVAITSAQKQALIDNLQLESISLQQQARWTERDANSGCSHRTSA
jgi:hypothetical protein